MKKLLAVLLTLVMALSLVACGGEKGVDPNVKGEGALTYAEFVSAANDTEVVIEGYVQGSQSYWGGATMYLADGDGGYFVYQGSDFEPNISEEDYEKLGLKVQTGEGWLGLANGTHVRVTGAKTVWKGQSEVWATADIPCKVEIIDDQKWLSTAVDVTDKMGQDLSAYNNMRVVFKDVEVVAITDKDGNEAGFLYNWDGSGEPGQNSDLSYNIAKGSASYNFVVESYLAFEGSEPYKAVTEFKVGDKVDVEGFLYFYNDAPELHTYAVTKK